MDKPFLDRRDAGRFLAKKMGRFAGRSDVLVLALPRGGVPVAHEIAKEIKAPLDVFVVRKLGVPGQEELALGAIASGGVRVLNHELIRELGISVRLIEAITAAEVWEVARRERDYRANRAPLSCRGRTVILVDDGLATGASMRAAVQALKTKSPCQIVVAVPVGSPETCRQLSAEVDEVICGHCPDDFHSVGAGYEFFPQVTDQEVRDLLALRRPDAGTPPRRAIL
jgi:predicted phosphoribosyltransferase